MKKIFLLLFVFAGACTIFFPGCKKFDAPAVANIDNSDNSNLSIKITTSVSGFVTDEANLPVSTAMVTAGVMTATTDSRGYFEIKNTELVKNAAVVSISKPGYFKAIKTWIASPGQAGFFRVILLAKTNAGSVRGNSGGTVILTNGMAVSFPSGAFVNAGTGAAYTGTVNVAEKWLDPSAPDLIERMPGDLRGKNDSGALKQLTTYGMCATELTGAAGELLQIATGKRATLTFPIPTSLQSTAPQMIPLWFFDEATGLWKQEGSATRSGTNYIGDVSHFSFWNCDVPNNYVQFDVTINDAGGHPVQNAVVKLTNLANGTTGYGFTNSTGFVSGAIPPNTSLLLQVLANLSCSFVLHSQNFTTSNTNISLPAISLLSNRTVRIYGNVTDCNNLHVTAGRVLLNYNYGFLYSYTDTAGNYSFTYPLCAGSTDTVRIFAENLTNGTLGNLSLQLFQPGSNNLLNLQACGFTTTMNEFLHYSYSNGAVYNYNVPVDSVKLNQGNIIFPTYSYYQLNAFHTGAFTNSTIQFGSTNLAVGQSIPIVYLVDSSVNVQGPMTGAILTLTEYGPIATGFIAGNLSGSVPLNGGGTATITGNFRARRPF